MFTWLVNLFRRQLATPVRTLGFCRAHGYYSYTSYPACPCCAGRWPKQSS